MGQATHEGTGEKELLPRQEDESKQQDSPRRSCLYTGLGYAAVILGTFLLCVSLMCAQALGGLVPPFELNGWRYCAQLIVVAPVLLYQRPSVSLERQRGMWLALVALCSITFNICYYTAGIYLPVGTVGGVQPSLTLLMCALVTVVLDRKCHCGMIVACSFCVTGILLVTQPTVLFGEGESAVYHPLCGPLSEVKPRLGLQDNMSTPMPPAHLWNSSNNSSMNWEENSKHVAVGTGYICVFGTAVAAVIMDFIVNKKLANVNVFVISFWVSLAGISSQFVIMSIIENPMLPDTPVCIGLLLGHSLGAAIEYVVVAWALQLIIPASVNLLMSVGVVFLFSAQYTFLKSVYPGRGNWIEVLGALLVLVGNVGNPTVEICESVKQGPGRQNYKQMS